MVSLERAFMIGTISFLLLLAVSSQVRHLGDMKLGKEVVLQYQLKKQGWNLADVSTRCSDLLQGESKRLE